MHASNRLRAATIAVCAAIATGAGAAPALASGSGGPGQFEFGSGHAVFVQNDRLAGNQIIAYSRSDEGTLQQVGVYGTGGDGGQLTGSVVDHTASQGSLTYDRSQNLLFAVNAGSNTLSVFSVYGDRLALRQVISSAGSFPVSVTVHDGQVYVLNALDGGSIQGYAEFFGHLFPIPASHRELNLATGLTGEETQFVRTPGQIAFSPDGTKLIITTKAAGQSVEVFGVSPFGRLSRTPVITPEEGTVPFAVTFDRSGNLLVAEAAGALASFQITEAGALSQLDSVATEQKATCWIVAAAGRFYTSNAGSATLTGFESNLGGRVLTKLGNTATDPGTVDAAAVGRYLYVQGGKEGSVDEFAVQTDGSLVRIGSVLVPSAEGGEGIVAD